MHTNADRVHLPPAAVREVRNLQNFFPSLRREEEEEALEDDDAEEEDEKKNRSKSQKTVQTTIATASAAGAMTGKSGTFYSFAEACPGPRLCE